MKIKIKPIITFGVIIIAFSTIIMSCVDEYWPEINSDDSSLLVVEGSITNLPGPYTVKLTRTQSIEESEYIEKETNATVIIEDDQGNSETLTEVDQGIYQTNINGIQGIVGRKYRVIIKTKGETYQSEYEILRQAVAIEDVYANEKVNTTRINDEQIDEIGYQFYISSGTAPSDSTYLQWELEETYEYHSRYPIWFQMEESLPYYWATPDHLTVVPDRYFLYYCWRTNTLPNIVIEATSQLNTPKVIDYPLLFVKYSDERLIVKYCLVVKQFTISKKYYEFLHAIKEQQSNQSGDLYTKQPYQIKGNLFNINDASERVIGYFRAAGASISERLFVRSAGEYWPEQFCNSETSASLQEIWRKLHNQGDTWPAYIYRSYDYPNDGEEPILVYWAFPRTPECLDCTLRGGDTIKPAYWDDVILPKSF